MSLGSFSDKISAIMRYVKSKLNNIFLNTGQMWPLAYAPNTTVINDLMQIVADRLYVNIEGKLPSSIQISMKLC